MISALDRVDTIGHALAEAHQLGVAPGAATEMHNDDFQRSVSPIYTATLPTWYLSAVAELYGAAETEMRVERPDPRTREAWGWSVARSYLGSVARVFRELSAGTPNDNGAQLPGSPSSLIRYGELAATVSEQAVEDLLLAVRLSRTYLGNTRLQHTKLCKVQRELIRRVARGDTVAKLAADSAVSERTMYRRLSDLWTSLGTRNRSVAVAQAAQLGLLD